MKLNNKGFAITAVLYGLLILFVMLVGSYLMILSARKNRLDSIVGTIEKEYNNTETNNGVESFADLVNLNSTITAGDGTRYYVDTTNNIIKDSNDNLRYYGASPNNYIKFNCEAYPDTNCETWRIIGMVDGKLKLMRNESIGSYSFDTTPSANNGKGVNDWSQSVLKNLLNPGSSSASANNSLYYNSGSGNCYSGLSAEKSSCNFSTKGLKNNSSNLIDDTIYYSGGGKNSEVYPNYMLNHERGSELISNPGDGYERYTKWTGKVAVPYPSDYAYAANLEKCKNTLDKYNDTSCTDNNWMYSILTGGDTNGWFITPSSGYPSSVWFINFEGNVDYDGMAAKPKNVVPVLSLNTNISVNTSHAGSSTDPYTLNVKDFNYTGNIQEYTIPKTGTYLLETWGAQGGNASLGGTGGYSKGEITLSKNNKLYVVVGGQGKSGTDSSVHYEGGYNGGGYAGINTSTNYGYGGGGATHIATSTGLLTTFSNKLSNLLIVSGGGGGGSAGLTTVAGAGGGYIGGMGTSSSSYNTSTHLPTGGTQTGTGYAYDTSVVRHGEFGTASQISNNGAYGGGGGGGFYGGSTGFGTTGSGGSGYIGNDLLTNKAMYCYNCTESNVESEKTISTTNVSDAPIANYAKKGNGYARITYIS